MPTGKEVRFAAMVDEVARKRSALAGRDNYEEGLWHGVAIGMLAMIRLEEEFKRGRRSRTANNESH